ncbi:hypothetical protein O181_004894 [Austropuccinia psidii MF-1]|uniref:Uncharacterized protein n=1 Tax=Austropuccinia psidii MF-1 TaxID=1389203 RepID=A0A9Q3BGM5_9BASI|nr:hypothetical protein [Austropuccinia psidii MF-1]
MLRRPSYAESLETRKEIEKHINELPDIDVIRKIVHNEIVKITIHVLITWHDGKPGLCGDLRALIDCTKADRYPYTKDTLFPRQSGKIQIYNQNGLYERLSPEWI